MARAFIFVLDSFGIGGAPDATAYGDAGSDTLGHIAEFCAAGAADRAEIDGLVDQLATVTIGRLVLISTVCVYPAGGAPDEGTPLSEGTARLIASRLSPARQPAR